MEEYIRTPRGTVLLSEAARRNQRLLDLFKIGNERYSRRTDSSSVATRPREGDISYRRKTTARPKSMYDFRPTLDIDSRQTSNTAEFHGEASDNERGGVILRRKGLRTVDGGHGSYSSETNQKKNIGLMREKSTGKFDLRSPDEISYTKLPSRYGKPKLDYCDEVYEAGNWSDRRCQEPGAFGNKNAGQLDDYHLGYSEDGYSVSGRLQVYLDAQEEYRRFAVPDFSHSPSFCSFTQNGGMEESELGKHQRQGRNFDETPTEPMKSRDFETVEGRKSDFPCLNQVEVHKKLDAHFSESDLQNPLVSLSKSRRIHEPYSETAESGKQDLENARICNVESTSLQIDGSHNCKKIFKERKDSGTVLRDNNLLLIDSMLAELNKIDIGRESPTLETSEINELQKQEKYNRNIEDTGKNDSRSKEVQVNENSKGHISDWDRVADSQVVGSNHIRTKITTESRENRPVSMCMARSVSTGQDSCERDYGSYTTMSDALAKDPSIMYSSSAKPETSIMNTDRLNLAKYAASNNINVDTTQKYNEEQNCYDQPFVSVDPNSSELEALSTIPHISNNETRKQHSDVTGRIKGNFTTDLRNQNSDLDNGKLGILKSLRIKKDDMQENNISQDNFPVEKCTNSKSSQNTLKFQADPVIDLRAETHGPAGSLINQVKLRSEILPIEKSLGVDGVPSKDLGLMLTSLGCDAPGASVSYLNSGDSGCKQQDIGSQNELRKVSSSCENKEASSDYDGQKLLAKNVAEDKKIPLGTTPYTDANGISHYMSGKSGVVALMEKLKDGKEITGGASIAEESRISDELSIVIAKSESLNSMERLLDEGSSKKEIRLIDESSICKEITEEKVGQSEKITSESKQMGTAITEQYSGSSQLPISASNQDLRLNKDEVVAKKISEFGEEDDVNSFDARFSRLYWKIRQYSLGSLKSKADREKKLFSLGVSIDPEILGRKYKRKSVSSERKSIGRRFLPSMTIDHAHGISEVQPRESNSISLDSFAMNSIGESEVVEGMGSVQKDIRGKKASQREDDDDAYRKIARQSQGMDEPSNRREQDTIQNVFSFTEKDDMKLNEGKCELSNDTGNGRSMKKNIEIVTKKEECSEKSHESNIEFYKDNCEDDLRKVRLTIRDRMKIKNESFTKEEESMKGETELVREEKFGFRSSNKIDEDDFKCKRRHRSESKVSTERGENTTMKNDQINKAEIPENVKEEMINESKDDNSRKTRRRRSQILEDYDTRSKEACGEESNIIEEVKQGSSVGSYRDVEEADVRIIRRSSIFRNSSQTQEVTKEKSNEALGEELNDVEDGKQRSSDVRYQDKDEADVRTKRRSRISRNSSQTPEMAKEKRNEDDIDKEKHCRDRRENSESNFVEGIGEDFNIGDNQGLKLLHTEANFNIEEDKTLRRRNRISRQVDINSENEGKKRLWQRNIDAGDAVKSGEKIEEDSEDSVAGHRRKRRRSRHMDVREDDDDKGNERKPQQDSHVAIDELDHADNIYTTYDFKESIEQRSNSAEKEEYSKYFRRTSYEEQNSTKKTAKKLADEEEARCRELEINESKGSKNGLKRYNQSLSNSDEAFLPEEGKAKEKQGESNDNRRVGDCERQTESYRRRLRRSYHFGLSEEDEHTRRDVRNSSTGGNQIATNNEEEVAEVKDLYDNYRRRLRRSEHFGLSDEDEQETEDVRKGIASGSGGETSINNGERVAEDKALTSADRRRLRRSQVFGLYDDDENRKGDIGNCTIDRIKTATNNEEDVTEKKDLSDGDRRRLRRSHLFGLHDDDEKIKEDMGNSNTDGGKIGANNEKEAAESKGLIDANRRRFRRSYRFGLSEEDEQRKEDDFRIYGVETSANNGEDATESKDLIDGNGRRFRRSYNFGLSEEDKQRKEDVGDFNSDRGEASTNNVDDVADDNGIIGAYRRQLGRSGCNEVINEEKMKKGVSNCAVNNGNLAKAKQASIEYRELTESCRRRLRRSGYFEASYEDEMQKDERNDSGIDMEEIKKVHQEESVAKNKDLTEKGHQRYGRLRTLEENNKDEQQNEEQQEVSKDQRENSKTFLVQNGEKDRLTESSRRQLMRLRIFETSVEDDSQKGKTEVGKTTDTTVKAINGHKIDDRLTSSFTNEQSAVSKCDTGTSDKLTTDFRRRSRRLDCFDLSVQDDQNPNVEHANKDLVAHRCNENEVSFDADDKGSESLLEAGIEKAARENINDDSSSRGEGVMEKISNELCDGNQKEEVSFRIRRRSRYIGCSNENGDEMENIESTNVTFRQERASGRDEEVGEVCVRRSRRSKYFEAESENKQEENNERVSIVKKGNDLVQNNTESQPSEDYKEGSIVPDRKSIDLETTTESKELRDKKKEADAPSKSEKHTSSFEIDISCESDINQGDKSELYSGVKGKSKAQEVKSIETSIRKTVTNEDLSVPTLGNAADLEEDEKPSVTRSLEIADVFPADVTKFVQSRIENTADVKSVQNVDQDIANDKEFKFSEQGKDYRCNRRDQGELKPVDLGTCSTESSAKLTAEDTVEKVGGYTQKRQEKKLTELSDNVQNNDVSSTVERAGGDRIALKDRKLESIKEGQIGEVVAKTDEDTCDGYYINHVEDNLNGSIIRGEFVPLEGYDSSDRYATGVSHQQKPDSSKDVDSLESKMHKIKAKMRRLVDRNIEMEERIDYGGREGNVCDDKQWEYFLKQNKLLQLAVSRLWQKEGFDSSRLIQDAENSVYMTGYGQYRKW